MARLPLHPFFVALVAVLSMYSARRGLSHPEEPLTGAAVALVAAAAALALGATVFRSARKGAILATAVMVAILVYDPVFRLLDGARMAGLTIGRQRYMLAAVLAALATITLWLARTRRPLHVATGLLNVVTGGALLVPLLSLSWFELRRVMSPPHSLVLDMPRGTARPAPLPDIYYFIFDRYADAQTLRLYGYDNSPLLSFLEQRGFYVANDSRSNYLTTTLSVASSLNFTFLDELARRNGPDTPDWLPVFRLIREHRLGRFLRAQGYHHVHAGSWWWPSKEDRTAARNINYYRIPPRAVTQLLDSGLIEPARRAIRTPWIDDRYKQWLREQRKLEDLLLVPADDRPTFVFAHMLIPHPPYVFDRDGSFLPLDEMNRRTWEQNYVNQLAATSAFIRRIVDAILQKPGVPPIIVIQSDEGPYPRRFRAEQDDFDWRQATPGEVGEKTGILNAYFLSGAARSRLYPEITPVNSFRVILNEYFGADLPLLPDQTIGHESDRHPYNMFDLTHLARGTAVSPDADSREP